MTTNFRDIYAFTTPSLSNPIIVTDRGGLMVKIGMSQPGGVPARLRGFQANNIERLTLIGVWRTIVKDSALIRACRDEGWIVPDFMKGTGETVLLPIQDSSHATDEADFDRYFSTNSG